MRHHNLIQPPAMPDPLRSMSEMVNLANGLDDYQAQHKQRESQKSIEGAMKDANGDPEQAAVALGSKGLWTEAGTIRQKQTEIRTHQQQELASTFARAQQGFQTATQYLQGVEAEADPIEKNRLFQTVRPKLLEALPQMAEYIPQSLDEDPGFVGRAIPLGLSASEMVARHKGAIDKLNEQFVKQGTQLDRDAHVGEALSVWIKDATTGEEVEQGLKTGETVYGASKALREHLGEIPPGPLTPEVKAGLLSRLSKDKEPASIEAAILAADRRGDTKEVKRLLDLGGKLADQRRAPGESLADKVDDKQYTRDWNEYKEYLNQYERTQPKNDALSNVVAALLAGKTPDEAARDAGTETTNYKKPPDFATWRAQNKGTAAAGKPAAAPPASSAGATHEKGEVVIVRGQKIKITKLYPDGTFDGDVVK